MTASIEAQDYSAKQDGGKSITQKKEKTPKVKQIEPARELNHEFGLASGFTTGYGMSYRYWPKTVGFQLTTFPSVSSGKKNLSLGLTSLFQLDKQSWYRLFAFAAGNFNWTENPNHDDYYDDFVMPFVFFFNLNAPYEEIKRYTMGFGPGIEFILGRHIGLNFMTGFRYTYTDFAISKDEKLLTLTGDIALYYKF